MADLLMPRLSDSMEEGTVVRWLREEGDVVARGEEVVEIETDKATMTHEADADGALAIVVAPGETVAIGTVIATIGAVVAGTGGGDGAAPRAEARAAPAGPRGDARARPAPRSRDRERVRASPLARRLAHRHGVDLGGLAGSGPGGRVVRADVEAAVAAGTPPAPAPAAAAPPPPVLAAPAPPPTPAPAAAPPPPLAPAAPSPPPTGGSSKGEPRVVELTRAQQVVARRMAEAKATIPEFTLTTEVDMEACVAARDALRRAAGTGAPVPSYNDMVIKACALALREHPRANAAYRDGRIEEYPRVNVGTAVAAPDALVVATVFDADGRGLGELAAQTRALAARVRSGEITPPELSGQTFTVSNLGMYGVSRFTAVINPPQAAILAVGALSRRVVAVDGAPAVRHRMDITLACDHRVLYGADAAAFLARIRALLEAPFSLGG